ncbi:viral enhancin protein [Salmonella enterica subsp. enterica]|uniref:Viral enhancin protein n=1 Tax=Salmonella enterica I TaxID=59201 RepID=A0A379VVH5_SALET|nr:viral enhancin protein [Salmonella enterica subsp. enterica]
MAQPYAACKNDLWLMLSHIEEPTRSALMRDSVDVLPTDNSEPGEGIGKGVTLQFTRTRRQNVLPACLR